MNEKAAIVIVIVSIVVTLVVGVLALTYWLEKKRTEELKKVAADLSFEFFPKGRHALIAELSHFHLFNMGHSKSLKNLMEGSAGGIQLCIFDYRYVTGHGKHSQTWNQSVFLARCEGMALPHFSLRPETIWHKLGNLFGLRDIDFESHPTFSRRYLLKGSDEDSIRKLFRPEILEYFEEHTGLNVEGAGEQLIFSKYKRLKPDTIRDFMGEGFALLKLFQSAGGPGA